MMDQVYVFFIRNDIWIYILSVMGLFWFGSEFLRARGILRRAVYGLEREKGTRLRNNSSIFILLFTVTISIVYYINAQIAPTLPPELLLPPTPTPNIFATPLSSPTPLGGAQATTLPEPTAPLVPTITLASQPPIAQPAGESTESAPPVTPEPAGATATPFVDCITALNISEPRNGAVVSGAVTFNGTANTQDLAIFRLEANGPQTNGQWASLLGRDIEQAVTDGFLGSVNLSDWQPGPYLIRLTAVDSNGAESGFCVIQITLADQ